MTATGSPWAWHSHPLAWGLVGALGIAYAIALHRFGPVYAPPRPVCSRRQLVSFAGGLVALALAFTWPLADLGRHWSLLAHMFDMSLLALAAPPLLLLGLPRWLVVLVTGPVSLDTLLRRLTRPWVATLIFNGVVVGSLVPAVIAAGDRHAAVAALVQTLIFVAALIMWTPVLRVLPGSHQMSTAARIGYLFLQSVLPNFPALVYIFAHHPIYPAFALGARAVGLSPLADQQLAGAVAKLIGIGVLWGTAGLLLVRAQRAEEAGMDPDPLTWEDVEHELRRLEHGRKGGDATGPA